MKRHKQRIRKNKKGKNNHSRLFLLLIILFGVIFTFAYKLSQFTEEDIAKKQLRIESAKAEVLEEIIVSDLNSREQITYFAERFGVLNRLLRFSRSGEFTVVQLPVNLSEVDLYYANFQLTKFLKSHKWQQLSGVESVNQNLQILSFVSPSDSLKYRFRIYYDKSGAYPAQKPKAAIVVKGFGSLTHTELERWLSIDNDVCYSVLPINRISRMNIQNIVNHNYEALVELPLEEAGYPVVRTEEYAIFGKFKDSEVNSKLDQYFKLLPNAVGTITNRGGLITTDRRIMPIILQFLKDKDLYFIDDKPIETSIAYSLAQQMMLNSYEKTITFNPRNYLNDSNNIKLRKDFLDINRNRILITLQRPDDITYDFLKKLIKVIKENGYEIVRVSEL